MFSDFVANQVRRANRNLLIVNLFLLLTAGGLLVVSRSFLSGFVFGGTVTNGASVPAMSADSMKVLEVYAEKVAPTGYQKIKKENGVEKAVWEYLAIPAGDRILLVQAKAGSRGPHFSGVLKPVPGQLLTMIAQDVKDPADRARVLPVMLDAIEYRGDAWLMLLIGLPLVLLSAWNLTKYMQRAADATAHPVYRKLQARGGMMAAQQIDSEMAQGPQKIGKSFLTKSWVLAPHFFGVHVMHVDDVVWTYKKVVRHYHNFIPTGKTYAAVLCGASGASIEIGDKEKLVDQLLDALLARAPWVAAGYSKDVQSIWTSNRDALVQAVNQRRSEALRKASSQSVASAAPVPSMA